MDSHEPDFIVVGEKVALGPLRVSANPTEGQAPLSVAFSSAGTTDPDGDELRYRWDFDANGRVDSREPNPTFT